MDSLTQKNPFEAFAEGILQVFLLIAFNVYGSDYNILMLIMTINVIAVAFDISFFYQAKEQFGKIVFLTILNVYLLI